MKVTLMADISLRADVGCEEFASVLNILDVQLLSLSPEGQPRALPQQFDNATGDAGCQIEYVVDGDRAVDYFAGSILNCIRKLAMNRRRSSVAV
jgi:hypothetical protein